MKSVRILSTGYYVPENVITNKDLEGIVTNYNQKKANSSLPQWILRHYGIKERRWAGKNQLPSDMATKAASQALAQCGLTPADIDFLILNTAFGDYGQPTTATAVQRKLGMRPGSFAIELNMPCAGPVYGMVIGHNFIQSGQFSTGLVIGAAKMSALIDTTDFKMASLFGDGAGACILTSSGNKGIVQYHLGSKGEEGYEKEFALVIPGGKAAHPASEVRNKKMYYLRMNGKKTESFFKLYFKDTIQQLLINSALRIGDIDFLVPHQASKPLISSVINELGFPEEKIIFTLEKFGNTSSASIFITLDKLFRKNLSNHSKIVVAGIGGGLNWGSLLYEVT